MRYKILSIIFSLLFISISANAADKLHVSAIEEFSTDNPAQSIDVSIVESAVLRGHILHEGDILHCNVVKIIQPKRGKRSASFTVVPTYYISKDERKDITANLYGKYSARILSKKELQNIDKKKVGKKAVIAVGNHFVKGVAPVASLAEGMVKNEEGNRIESGVKQVYNDSVLSYVEKGQQLRLEPGTQFYLIFKPSYSVNIDTEDEIDSENK